MTGTVCSSHISAVDHLLSDECPSRIVVVCTRLNRSLGAVLPFSPESRVSSLMKSVGYGWLMDIKRDTR